MSSALLPQHCVWAMVHLQERCQGHQSHQKWSDGDQGRPRPTIQHCCHLCSHPGTKMEERTFEYGKKMQQNIRNVKWEAKTYIFKPSSYKWLCLSIIMFSAIFNIEVHEDRFLGDLLNKNLQAPCTLLLHPRTDRRHQTPWRDIQVHAGPSWACGRLPQRSSCAAEISLKAEYKMCVLQKILKKRSYPGFSYRLM